MDKWPIRINNTYLIELSIRNDLFLIKVHNLNNQSIANSVNRTGIIVYESNNTYCRVVI